MTTSCVLRLASLCRAPFMPPDRVVRRVLRTTWAFLLAVTLPLPLAAQIPAGEPRPGIDSVVVVPGAHYHAGPFQRWLFGAHYRRLWTAPLTVPVLSLERYGGGLRPLQRGGSMQTKSLRFRGGDNREYVFRSTDKDPSRSLPEELRGTYADRIVRDLISAEHPGAGLIVARLADAAGVLHAMPQLVVLPDDSLLGEFRSDFAGMLGTIEVRPTDDPDDDGVGFAGAKNVSGSEKLLERVTKDAEHTVDARAYLTARLLDMVIGDWDRHPDQWRWARFGSDAEDQWKPIPRDRDWALVKMDGVVWWLARFAYPYPQFVSFEPGYPDLVWLTWSGRLLDRRLLAELERPAWDSVARTLQHSLSDAVIDQAIARLPEPLAAASAEYVRGTLVSRRDALADAAARFYALLAKEAEVHGTDEDELVEVTRVDDRITEVSIRQFAKSGTPRSRVWFRRRFDAAETGEIRIFLEKGDDRVIVRGASGTQPKVRVVGGGGRNTFVDSTRGGDDAIRYYDANPAAVAEGTARAIDRSTYVPPKTRRGWIDPPRDWGERWRPLPWVGYTPDAGLFVGGGPLLERYGFRHSPYALSTSVRAGYAVGVNRWRAEWAADVRRASSRAHATFLARASQLDILHFHGFGNETAAGSSLFHRVDQGVLSFEPTVHLPLASSLTLGVGATVRRSTTELEDNRFISVVRPYGSSTFSQLGLRAGLTLDTRDVAAYAKRGVLVSVEGSQFPGIWSATSAYGAVRSQAAAYLSLPTRFEPVLALRAGGDRIWGRYPFFDAAFLGGGSTLRGWRDQRFAGDASAYGNAELRFFLSRVFLLLPADLGVFGLADGGRVFVSGEQSDVWHTGVGGGLWVSFLGRANTFSIAMAHGREGNGFYFRSGLLF